MAGTVANTARGKQSVVLNLKTPEGKEAFLKMISKADVFAQNFRPGAVEKLGIDYESLRKINPNLIYVTSTGFGSSGPYKSKRVYDMLIQALSGMTSFVDREEPKLMPHSLIDKATGQALANAIMGALFARARGGGGQHLETSMINVALHWMWPDVYYNYTWPGIPKQDPIQKILPQPKAGKNDNGQALESGKGSKWYTASNLLFGDFRCPYLPYTFSATPLAPRPAAPMLGEHTRKILLEHGYSAQEVQKMIDSKAATSTASLLLMKKEGSKAKVFTLIEKLQSGGSTGAGSHIGGGPLAGGVKFSGLKPGQPPLTGVRVLDASTMLCGPLCCALLADDGADVIKLEIAEQLDPGRCIGPSPAGVKMGGFFMAANRSKRSIICKDLVISKDFPNMVVRRLAASCDIIVADGTVGGDAFIQYCQSLPNAILVKINRGSGDFTVQSECGMLAEQLDNNKEKTLPPTLQAEKAAAFFAAIAAKAALLPLAQGQMKSGQTVDIDMERACWHTYWIDGMWNETWVKPKGPKFPTVASVFNNFILKTKDGRCVITGVVSDKEWQEFLRSELCKRHPPPEEKLEAWKTIQGRLAEFDVLLKRQEEILAQYDYKTLEALCLKDGLICSLCCTPEECLSNEQVLHNKSVSTYKHPSLGNFQLANHPVKYSAAETRPFAPAPLPGEHTRDILASLSPPFAEDEIKQLFASGAVM
jgi:crotonobetainyl-CoA:carnitine CoA-transferase CaiB-like acyl-CoA transferase